jgi:hypothetical protein
MNPNGAASCHEEQPHWLHNHEPVADRQSDMKCILLLGCLFCIPLGCGGNGSNPVSTASPSHERHVTVEGNDANDGSASTPWKTIQHAASALNPGDILIVEDGVYSETVAIARGGTSGAPIVIKARNKGGAKIAPSSTDGNSGTSIIISASNVSVQGFEITGTNTSSTGIKLAGAKDAAVDNVLHDIGVSGSTCTSGAAILVANDNQTITDNLIYNIGPPRTSGFRCNLQHGIYITAGGGGFVQNNVLMQVWQGVALHINGSNLSNWTVSNNTIVNVGDSGHNSGGPFFFDCISGTCDRNIFNNNIFANTQGGSCWWEVRESGATLGTHNSYQNNLTFNCGSNILVTGNPQNGVTSDPQFMNYTGGPSGDYHLSSTSPAINRGTSVGAPATDKDGVPRPQGSAVDIGAYERDNIF